MNFAIFPTDKGISVSHDVAKIVRNIRRSDYPSQLTAMGTIIETETLNEALAVIDDAYKTLEEDCERVYITVNIDIRKGKKGRMEGKIRAIEDKLEGKD